MRFSINVNFTNLIGALLLGRAIYLGRVDVLELIVWPCVIMILGRAVIPEITKLAEVVLSAKKGVAQ